MNILTTDRYASLVDKAAMVNFSVSSEQQHSELNLIKMFYEIAFSAIMGIVLPISVYGSTNINFLLRVILNKKASYDQVVSHRTEISSSTGKIKLSLHHTFYKSKYTDRSCDDMIPYTYNYTVAWLHENPESSSFRDREIQRFERIGYLQTFQSVESFIDYLNNKKNKAIFLIISGSFNKDIISFAHELSQIAYIYVFNTENDTRPTMDYPKFRGCFTNINELYDRVNIDRKIHRSYTVPLTMICLKAIDQSCLMLPQDDIKFKFFQMLLITFIYGAEHYVAGKRELLQQCRALYCQDKVALDRIDEFEMQYDPKEAIRWYTANSFIYRLLNGALRLNDMVLILNFGFYIADVYRQLTLLHKLFIQDLIARNEQGLTVYRGQLMSIDELKLLRNNIRGSLSINTFFSTSLSSEVAIDFAGDGCGRPSHESVLFMIDICAELFPKKPFANIKTASNMPGEDEVLFFIGTVFRIKSVKPWTDKLWVVHLKMLRQQPNIDEFFFNGTWLWENRNKKIEILATCLKHSFATPIKSSPQKNSILNKLWDINGLINIFLNIASTNIVTFFIFVTLGSLCLFGLCIQVSTIFALLWKRTPFIVCTIFIIFVISYIIIRKNHYPKYSFIPTRKSNTEKLLEYVKPFFSLVPKIQVPSEKLRFRDKLEWTGILLFIFIIYSQIPVFGVSSSILHNRFTLLDIGMGPYILSSYIILFIALVNISRFDATPKCLALFDSLQKLCIMVISISWPVLYIMTDMYDKISKATSLLIVIQSFVAACIVSAFEDFSLHGYVLDSISHMMIVIDTCANVVICVFSPAIIMNNSIEHFEGAIPALFHLLNTQTDKLNALWEAFFRANLPNLWSLLATIFLCAVSIYLLNIQLYLPVRSISGHYDVGSITVPLLYTGNMPSILQGTFISILYFLSYILSLKFSGYKIVDLLGVWKINRSYPTGGLCYYISPPESFAAIVADPLHTASYIIFILVSSILFSIVWSEISESSAKCLAMGYLEHGYVLRGYNKVNMIDEFDPYVPKAVIIGGFCNGIFSILADLLGTYVSFSQILSATSYILYYYRLFLKAKDNTDDNRNHFKGGPFHIIANSITKSDNMMWHCMIPIRILWFFLKPVRYNIDWSLKYLVGCWIEWVLSTLIGPILEWVFSTLIGRILEWAFFTLIGPILGWFFFTLIGRILGWLFKTLCERICCFKDFLKYRMKLRKSFKKVGQPKQIHRELSITSTNVRRINSLRYHTSSYQFNTREKKAHKKR